MIYEFRTYTYGPGAIPKVIEAWTPRIKERSAVMRMFGSASAIARWRIVPPWPAILLNSHSARVFKVERQLQNAIAQCADDKVRHSSSVSSCFSFSR